MLRGSLDSTQGDPAWDLRKVEPYCGYETYDFKAIVGPFADTPAGAVIGDCWHRFYVRMLEVLESIKLCEQGLNRYAQAQGAHVSQAPHEQTCADQQHDGQRRLKDQEQHAPSRAPVCRVARTRFQRSGKVVSRMVFETDGPGASIDWEGELEMSCRIA